ncbi:MAG: type 1 glutamine amidotransferase [Rhodobacteraceae bacterium]|nr:type 1 glutamine amidotransferase [Paracoccaceae bacterium]
MQIAILDFTAQPSPLLDGVPRVSFEIADWLCPELPEARFAHVDIAHGAAVPGLDSFDGLILSGSEYGAYDEVDWMTPLRGLLNATRDAAKPVFGICFGHQVMADTFGGRAEKADLGVIVGQREFDIGTDRHSAHVWHQDQVTRIPPGATVTARADYCPVGGLEYDFPAASVQFHPEYTQPRLEELFERGRNIFIAPSDANAALASFEEGTVDKALAAADTAAFFRRCAGM